MPDQAVYSIGAIARMLGIPAATIRTWEERYGVVVPERSPGGHRLYSRLQVEQLRFVGDRLSDGMSVGDAYRLLQGRLSSGVPLESVKIPDGGGLLILLAEQDPVRRRLLRLLPADGRVRRHGHLDRRAGCG